jgi:hypothetical protein
MEAHRLSGGMAPLNFKLGTRQLWVMRLNPVTTLLPDKALVYIELETGWVLQLVWMFWGRHSFLASAKIWTKDFPIQCTDYAAAKIWTPDLTAYILVSLLTVLPHTDLKIKQKSVLRKWDGRFGLGVFDSWQEFLEGFSEHGSHRCRRGK